MSTFNKMPNVHISSIEENSRINFGVTTNKNRTVVGKVIGSTNTVGDNGISLDFQKNLLIGL